MIIEPIVYYWEDPKEKLITAACKAGSLKWGLSFPMSENATLKRMDKKKLIRVLTDTLDVLINHGEEILDENGNINWTKVNDAEARRALLDKNWVKRLKLFRRAISIKEIELDDAKKERLL